MLRSNNHLPEVASNGGWKASRPVEPQHFSPQVHQLKCKRHSPKNNFTQLYPERTANVKMSEEARRASEADYEKNYHKRGVSSALESYAISATDTNNGRASTNVGLMPIYQENQDDTSFHVTVTGARTSQSQTRQVSNLKIRPQTLAISGPVGMRYTANSVQKTNNLAIQGNFINHKAAILKNKYVHKGSATAQAPPSQRLPSQEQPRLFGISDEDIAATESAALVEDEFTNDKKPESQPKHGLINLNPI